jgi:hypothetical protein
MEFKAFSGKEWERVEALTPEMKLVGQMMLLEGRALARGRELARERCSVDEAHYARLCSAAGLPSRAKARPAPKAASVRGKILAQAQEQDAARVRALRGGFPRWETAQNRWEWFLVAFRAWARAPGTPRQELDRLLSLRNLRALLDHADLEDDVRLRMEGASFRSFRSTLELVAEHEDLLVAPSFSRGWRGPTLYPEQRAMAAAVLEALRAQRPLFVRYCTPPSTGKSSAAAFVGAMVDELRQRRQLFVVYVCYSESVRFDVAKMCAAAALPFAIVSQQLACPSYSCYNGRAPKKPPAGDDRMAYSLALLDKCDRQPAVLIADPDSAVAFLRRRQGQDVLLFDEPNSDVSAAVSAAHEELTRCAPRVAVYMSATLPPLDAMDSSGKPVHDVESTRIVSPCTVIDAAGKVFAPHRLFRDSPRRLCQLLDARIHLRRLYSPRALLQLLEDLDFPSEADAAEALSFEGIREQARALLERCDAMPGVVEEYVAPAVPLLCTRGAGALPGTSLFVADDEDAFAREALAPLLESAERLSKRLASLQAERARFSKERPLVDARASQTERLRAEDSLRSSQQASPLWPLALCVNTREHAARFGAALAPEHLRSPPLVPEDIVESSCERLVEAALSGVCQLNSSRGDAAFSLVAQNMAEAKAFSFVVGGRSAIYGVNLPCDRVLVLLTRATSDALVQCLGRCGRTGKFTKSEVIFAQPQLAKQLFE